MLRISGFLWRLGKGVCNFLFFSFWRSSRQDQDLAFLGLFLRPIRRFFLTCASNIAPALKILKKDLLKLAKMTFSSFHLFLEKMLRAGVVFLMESLKHLLKNDLFFKRTAFCLAVVLIIWVFILIFKWISNRFFLNKKKTIRNRNSFISAEEAQAHRIVDMVADSSY